MLLDQHQGDSASGRLGEESDSQPCDKLASAQQDPYGLWNLQKLPSQCPLTAVESLHLQSGLVACPADVDKFSRGK